MKKVVGLVFLAVVLIVSLLLGMTRRDTNVMECCVKEHKEPRYCGSIIEVGLYK